MNKSFVSVTLLFASCSAFAQADDTAVKAAVQKLGVKQGEIAASPLADMRSVLTNSGVIYISSDGKYIIQGPLYDISGTQPVNITNTMLMTRLNAMENDMIVYKPAKEQHVVTVFTDTTCGYCHKLHEEMKDYNALGITVRYLAFPREGLKGDTAKNMQSIWCAKDRNAAFDTAMKKGNVPTATCDIDIGKQYELGLQFGIQGTPALVLSDGSVSPGYQGPKALKAMLNDHKKRMQ